MISHFQAGWISGRIPISDFTASIFQQLSKANTCCDITSVGVARSSTCFWVWTNGAVQLLFSALLHVYSFNKCVEKMQVIKKRFLIRLLLPCCKWDIGLFYLNVTTYPLPHRAVTVQSIRIKVENTSWLKFLLDSRMSCGTLKAVLDWKSEEDELPHMEVT